MSHGECRSIAEARRSFARDGVLHEAAAPEACAGQNPGRIVTLVAAGERDPDRLCDKALVAVGFLPH